MTKEQRDKILKALAEDRNEYARGYERRVAEECGKIRGADYMIQRFLDVLGTEVEPQESDHKCHTCKHYTSGEHDGSCGSYICKGYSNWESEDKE